MTHNMKLNKEPFELISNGIKTIEMRLYDEKRQQISVGDFIVFISRENGEEVTTRVLALHRFPSFRELYNNMDKKSIGYKENEIASPKDMEKYYPVEDIEKYGVVGIEVEVVRK